MSYSILGIGYTSRALQVYNTVASCQLLHLQMGYSGVTLPSSNLKIKIKLKLIFAKYFDEFPA